MKTIYTDGSCRGNPGPGGWSCVVIDEQNVSCYYGTDSATTNNRMELQGLLTAFRYADAHPDEKFEIICDSAYCVQMCNDWIFKWIENGWRTAAKKPVQNLELVQAIYQYLTGFPNFTICRCEGHAGVAGNEIADALATGNLKRLQYLLDYYDLTLQTIEEE